MKIKLGAPVRLNNTVAFAFIGATGKAESFRPDPLNNGVGGSVAETLVVVRLDTPTAAAKGWPELETLAVSPSALESMEMPPLPSIARPDDRVLATKFPKSEGTTLPFTN